MASSYADENGVFRNKLGITDAAELKAIEYSLTSRRLAELEAGRVTLNVQGFGLARLQAIHGHLFQDVYGWAGQLRTVPSSKQAENGMVSVFEQPAHIVSSWEMLAEKTAMFVAATGLTLEERREQCASFYMEANRIHPFPEGNGRSLQTFMRQLARDQGLELDFTRTNTREWNLASALSGTHGRLFDESYLIPNPPETEPIRRIFAAIGRPAVAWVFEKLPEAEACARFPELCGVYAGLRAIEQRATASSDSKPEHVDGYMRQVREAFVKRLDEGRSIELAPPITLVRDSPRERDR